MGSLRETIVSFFKVMIDEDFLRVLYLPPKFTRIAPDLLKNTKTYLQDLSERKWNVAVSKENGSFAIKKGWSDFGKAHNLEIGDIVVFHYFPGRYFTVQIFNRSACDVRNFGVDVGSTRKRRRPEVIAADKNGKPAGNRDLDPLTAAPMESYKKGKREPADFVVPMESNKRGKREPADFGDADIQFLMIDRNRVDEKREDRMVIDLSSYEMPNAEATSVIQKAANGSPVPHAGVLVKHEAEPGSTDAGNYDLPAADVVSVEQWAGNGPLIPHAGAVVQFKAEPGSMEVANLKQETKWDVVLHESAKQMAIDRSWHSDVKREVHDTLAVGAPSRMTPMSPKYDAKSEVKKLSTAKPVVKIKKEPGIQTSEETVIDLSDYKMSTADVKGSKERAGSRASALFAGSLVKCKAEPGSAEVSNIKQEMQCNAELPERMKPVEIRRSSYAVVNRKVCEYDTTVAPGHTAPLVPKCDTNSDFLKLATPKSGREAKTPYAPGQSGNAFVKVKKEPQTETFEETGLAFVTAGAGDLHCPITSASSLFLELPASLPLFRLTSQTSDAKLVILRDAASRVWPVHYYHKPSMKILTTGWSAFSQANKVQLGDECIFKVAPEEETTYDVSIVRQGSRPIS
uniref:TF-B3 domain-containing protein n=1 Tax=Kalanchoe fedtschenkoi TaxID=63787 RepID=A0A7N0RJR1_KALFE